MRICISGIIGAGKSTLSEQLGEELKAHVFHETVDENKYLPLFYKDMEKYSFPMQIFLLTKRFQQHQQMLWKQEVTIQDRCIYEDIIFAKMLKKSGLMTDLDFHTYENLYKNLSNFLQKPDIIIYLDVTPEKALERIKMRGRESEKTITLSYLRMLKECYEEWLKEIGVKIVRLDWNTFQDVKKIRNSIM